MKVKEDTPAKNKVLSTMDIILIVVGILLVAFTIKMIFVYETTGDIPDTLCNCVFAALGGECGIMGWIKTTKEKNKDREWLLEDRENQEAEPPTAKG